VAAGKQYWIVAHTSPGAVTDAIWEDEEIDQVDPGTFATYCSDDMGGSCGSANDKWQAQSSTVRPAFAVFGSN
jgi:hypothetical protein